MIAQRDVLVHADTACLMRIFASFHSIIWVTSFFLLLVNTIYLVFCYLKRNDDTEFSRRIIAMPFIMSLIISLQYICIAMFISFRLNFNQCHHPIDFVATGSQNGHGDTE